MAADDPKSPVFPDLVMAVPDDVILRHVRMYRETLQATRGLYLESGDLIRGSYGWLRGGSSGDGGGSQTSDDPTVAESIASQMDDLHHGFVMKVFATVVPRVDAAAMGQRQMGRALLQHIWGKSVLGTELHGAVDWLIGTAGELQWSDLIRPFAEIPSLRDRMGELETLATRMAKLIAGSDGNVDGGDRRLIAELSGVFGRGAAAAPERLTAVADTDNAREAIDWLRNEAKRLRGGTGMTDDTRPTFDPASLGTPPGPGPGSPSRSGDDDQKSTEPKPTATSSGASGSSTDNRALKVTEVVQDDRTPEQRLTDARAKLDRLVGLESIKDQIQTLVNFLQMEKHRAAEGLPTTRPNLHMVFVGNPGTGKTTVSRIIAEIYGALGILAKGHLVETDRSGLVAEYAGQTGPKSNATIDQALDGVLFIDEAYSLIDPSGQDQYGREAVQTLLKRMEDDRERLVVILAGYPDEMRTMIRSNPGLSSRVGVTMHFDDYPPMALCQIFELIAGKAKYELPTDTRRRLLNGFSFLFVNRDRHFGNGRTSRNSFEQSVRQMANRISGETEITRELLTTLTPGDVVIEGLDAEVLDVMCETIGKIRVACPECHHADIMDDTVLGTTAACPKCKHERSIKWGEPVPNIPTSAAGSGAVAEISTTAQSTDGRDTIDTGEAIKAGNVSSDNAESSP